RKPDVVGVGANRGVHTHDLTAQVDERAAGVALVDGRVGLQEIVVAGGIAETSYVFGGPSLRRENAGGNGVREIERVANNDDPIADLDRIRIAQRKDRELF